MADMSAPYDAICRLYAPLYFAKTKNVTSFGEHAPKFQTNKTENEYCSFHLSRLKLLGLFYLRKVPREWIPQANELVLRT